MLMQSDPFRELDRLTRQLWGNPSRPVTMPMDAYRKGDHLIAEFDLPGVDESSIDITVDRNVLSVRATRQRVESSDGDLQYVSNERTYGTFTRELYLGEALDSNRIEADYSNGVLKLLIPVAESAKPKKVQLGSGGLKKPTAIAV